MYDSIDKLADALLSLLKTNSKITISAINSVAQVNRSTFYRHFETIDDLFVFAVKREVTRIMTVHIPTIKTENDIIEICKKIHTLFISNKENLILLGSFDILTTTNILYNEYATAIKEKISNLAKNFNILAFQIETDAALLCAELFVSNASQKAILIPQKAIIEKFTTQNFLVEYIAVFLSKIVKGGSTDFHLYLITAFEKLVAKNEFTLPTVTELVNVAGIHRSEFYLYYNDINDFADKFAYAAKSLVVSYIYNLLEDENPANYFFDFEKNLRDTEFVLIGICADKTMMFSFIADTMAMLYATLREKYISQDKDTPEIDYLLKSIVCAALTALYRYLTNFNAINFSDDLQIVFEMKRKLKSFSTLK